MAKVTSEQFVELAMKSQLADQKALSEAADALRRENAGQLPEDPVEVAKTFEKAKLLTRWHCEKLLQGKYRGFFLGKHKLLGHLGTGGMSTVYLAEHLLMHHKRAIKVMPKSKLGNNSYLLRFQQEAKAIASLNHPNIVRAFDIDNESDTHYIVMEFVDGADIQTIVKKHGPLSYDKAADYTIQAARGLQHAHDMGLIHRDVKPANLLVNREEVVKVLDLGLALFADDELSSLTIEHNDKVLGTADYLAPEQALNSHKIDFRADIYALGCSLYFMLTGHPPFPEGSIAQRIAKHQKMMPESIRKDRADCPGELEGICVKMMQKDPRYRYVDCAQVAEVLENWLATYRINAMPTKKAVAASAALGGQSSLFPGGGSSSSTLGSSLSSGKNLGGESSSRMSSIVSISASDSGVLRKMASASGSIIDSQVNLENDSNSPISHRKATSQKEIEAEQRSAAKRISRIAQATARKNESDFDRATRPSGSPLVANTATRNAQQTSKMPVNADPQSSRLSPLLIAVGVLVLLAAAVTLGFFLARWAG